MLCLLIIALDFAAFALYPHKALDFSSMDFA